MHQRQHPTIRYLLAHQRQQAIVWYRVKVALQIDIHDIRVAFFQVFLHATQRVFAAPTGAKAIAVFRKVPLKYRLQYITQRRLDHPVSNSRNP